MAQIHPLEEEGISIYSNFRKCGLKYHLNWSMYGTIELMDLFITHMAMFLLNCSQYHFILQVLFPKWWFYYQK